MGAFIEALRSVTDPRGGMQSLRCDYCGAEALDDCDRGRHPATWPSLKAKHDRENRVWAIKFLVSGEWP